MPPGSYRLHDTRLTVRVPAQDRESLGRLAWDERRDLSDLIREAIQDYLAAHGSDQPKAGVKTP